MVKQFALSRRVLALLAAASLFAASALPLLIRQNVGAGQVSNRSVRITSSVVGATGVEYNFSFRPSVTTNILGIAVQICQNSPLPDSSCTTTNGVANGTADVSTVTVSQTGATPASVVFDVDDTDSNQADATLLTHATGFTAPVTGADMTFSLTMDNPTGTSATPGDPGTFYARVATYSTVVNAQTFDPGTGVMGTEIDMGGMALSTARQLTVNARVQEQLEFCVAAIAGTVDTNGEVPATCAAFPTSTTIDLGVVDSAVASISPVAATSGGNDTNGGVMIRTNAVNGAAISYFAEQETSSGRLKVAGATCSGSTAFDAGSSNVDQCFNSNADQDDGGNDFSAAGEKFGMTASLALDGGTTNNLTRDAEYDGDGTAAGGFAWTQTGANDPATTLASSTTVMDYEMLVLRFGARAAATTPTGSYAVTSTYIATATY